MSNTVDFRDLPKADWKRNLASLFEVIRPGESFYLLHELDPKGVIEGLQVSVPGDVRLEYVEKAPLWKLKVTKVSVPDKDGGCCGCCGGG